MKDEGTGLDETMFNILFILFMICKWLMADEVVAKKGSVNSSMYLSKEDEAERNEIFYSSQCLDFID